MNEIEIANGIMNCIPVIVIFAILISVARSLLGLSINNDLSSSNEIPYVETITVPKDSYEYASYILKKELAEGKITEEMYSARMARL